MLITIAGVLSEAGLQQAQAMLSAMRFEDGRATAGWGAVGVKDNEQARAGASSRILQDSTARAIATNEVFALAVRAKVMTPLLFSRYGVGRSYGSHIDNALIDGIRADVSFTLFLSAPDTYEGGELVIETVAGEEAIKPSAGDLVAYPSTSLHHVAPISRGERLAAVGWAQSYVRDPAKRELLFDLDTAQRGIFAAHGKTPEFDLISKSAANLLRLWAEV